MKIVQNALDIFEEQMDIVIGIVSGLLNRGIFYSEYNFFVFQTTVDEVDWNIRRVYLCRVGVIET